MNGTLYLPAALGAIAGISLRPARFQREWERFFARRTADLQGCWTGAWRSERERRDGTVRCVLTRIAPGTYVGSFSLQSRRWLSHLFDVQLSVMESGALFQVEGVADLGWLRGGVHRFSGQGSFDELVCRYDSRRDSGRLELRRATTGEARAGFRRGGTAR